MNLFVSFKIIPDLDQLSAQDYIITANNNIDTTFVRNILNCFDESSLEFGLRLSDEAESLNFNIQKTAFTIANEQAELYLQTLNALNYEHTVYVDSQDMDTRFIPRTIGTIIANYIKQNPQDFILMGYQATPGNNGNTPFYLSKELDIPIVTNIIDIHFIDDKHLQITTLEEDGQFIQTVKSPCILVIENAVISKLRVPTLKDRINTRNKKIQKLPLEAINDTTHKQIKLTYINRQRTGIILENNTDIEDFFEKNWKEKRTEIGL